MGFWTLALLTFGVGEDYWESLGLQGDPTQSILKEISPGCSLKGLMLKLKLQSSGHLMRRTDSLEKTLMLGKIEGGRRGDDRGWDGWMASLILWTWVWINSGSCWWTRNPGVLWSMELQSRTRLSNWTELGFGGRLSGVFSSTTDLRHQFFGALPCLRSGSWTWLGNRTLTPIFDGRSCSLHCGVWNSILGLYAVVYRNSLLTVEAAKHVSTYWRMSPTLSAWQYRPQWELPQLVGQCRQMGGS